MDQKFDRRQLLKTMGVSSLALGLAGTVTLAHAKKKDSEIPPSPYYGAAKLKKGHAKRKRWPYVELDPDEVAQRAYWGYYQGECMYGVAAAVIDTLREKIGGPWDAFPSQAALYGSGGVLGWATLCGANNAVGLIAGLVARDPMAVIDELYAFYSYAKLPNFFPKERKHPDMKIVRSVSDSVLCHVSVTNWCAASGHKAFAPERSERCGLVVASVAKKLVETLNADAKKEFVAAYPIPESVQECRGCHDKGSELENTRGKMECVTCHTDQKEDHP